MNIASAWDLWPFVEFMLETVSLTWMTTDGHEFFSHILAVQHLNFTDEALVGCELKVNLPKSFPYVSIML